MKKGDHRLVPPPYSLSFQGIFSPPFLLSTKLAVFRSVAPQLFQVFFPRFRLLFYRLSSSSRDQSFPLAVILFLAHPKTSIKTKLFFLVTKTLCPPEFPLYSQTRLLIE